jgi:DNA (cytosine-5)-methyltransferase 1
MNELALFAGAGGGILGGHLLGWRTVCAVEWESYPASVLCARQNDGLLPPFPIWDDVQTFDGKPWRGIVDVVSGGFPCQDISAAGKGTGIDGERSGMWGEMARIIHEVRPRFVFVENSPMLTSRGLGRVLGDLAAMGFDARWGVLGAADIGANHQRDRIWIVATTNANLHGLSSRQDERRSNDLYGQNRETQKETTRREISINGIGKISSTLADTRCELWSKGNSGIVDTQKEIGTSSPIFNQSSGQGCGEKQMAYSCDKRLQGFRESGIIEKSERQEGQPRIGTIGRSARWWQSEPNVGRVVNGMASRVDRLKAIGNGQVPLCAATAWRILND